jgi:hypothetical protein
MIEKNGAGFETVVPEKVLFFPEDVPGAATPISFGICITNQSQQPLRFCRYHTLHPRLIDQNGKHWFSLSASNSSHIIDESDCPFTEPGGNVTFLLNGKITWRYGKIHINGSLESGGVWHFIDPITPGTYGLYFQYQNSQNERRVFDRSIRTMKILKDFWVGKIESPVTEISFVIFPSNKYGNLT